MPRTDHRSFRPRGAALTGGYCITIAPTDFRSSVSEARARGRAQTPEPRAPPAFHSPSAHYASRGPCYSHAALDPVTPSPCTRGLLGTHRGPVLTYTVYI